ncbi:alanine--tRNA ligase [archaeon BMS3Abin17]|nr:alanine--tRNA ligase [archaeon BMS3Abin17]HDZ60616.1 alanine--tRNA ligase [Candidatus Pacearchaeota archaeon]
MINRKQLITKYVEFFKRKRHKEIPNVSLVPENDPTVLFTTAGMHPLVPYLIGQPHPLGRRLCNAQKCIRTQDIEEVGDTTHHTFFEMLGKWSLGDYWKKEAIQLTFDFHTKVLNIPIERYAVSVFKGDKNASKDTESAKIWESIGISKERIAFLPKSENWWGPAGKKGPCGPSTEMFYWKPNNIKPPKKFDPNNENWVEIGNDVLMEYNKDKKGNYNPAKQKNIDFGGGVERTTTILNGLEDDYLGDTFKPIIEKIEKLSGKKYGKDKGQTRAMRIIADHIKASVFIIADGITPSNTEQGYVLRRLIRRAIMYGKELGITESNSKIAEFVFKIYDDYKHLQKNKKKILEEIRNEEEKFDKVLTKGTHVAAKIFNKKIISGEKFSKLMQSDKKEEILKKVFRNKKGKKDYSIKEFNISKKDIDNATITGKEAFYLYQSFGYPLELIIELARSRLLLIDFEGYMEEFEKHRTLSRTASVGRFKSGLADASEQTTRLHTATHLLLEALRTVLKDKNILQKGSNITPERLRLDFSFPRKLTEKELKEVEDLVNAQIQKSCEVSREEMSPEQARKKGALGVFDEKYGEKVSVYTISEFSKEICAGPHVKNVCELGHFKIKKEESSSAGVRRIKAVLE